MYGMVIADDEMLIRKGLMSIPWSDYGIQVLGVAEDGEQAMKLLKSECPEILLTDIRMPGMDGLTLIVYSGCSEIGQTSEHPNKGFKAVDFGFSHIVALLNNGEVIAWGDNSHGQCDVPEQVFIQVYA